MEKKVIVVSGGMGGIGQSIVRKLASDGHVVHILYNSTPQDAVDSFLGTLTNPEMHTAHVCDICDINAVQNTISEIIRQSHHIDVCIHGAVSKLVRRRISLITPDEFKQQFEVTAFGGLNLLQTVVAHMKRAGSGSIIGITTRALEPESPPTTMAGYICAKHALRGILREFHADVSTNNIRVNAIAPDFVDTPLHNDLPPRALEIIKSNRNTPLTTPDDIATLCAYLCSGKATKVTGQTFVIGDTNTHPL